MAKDKTNLHACEEARSLVRRLAIKVIDGPDRGLVQQRTGDTLSLGTSPDNDVVLTDQTVSRYHLELRAGEGVRVRDLGSRNGTFVGNVRLFDAVLPVGARVRLGRTVLVLLDAVTETAAAAPGTTDLPDLVGVSTAMQDVARAIKTLAPSSVSVLVQGETGTGKELVARAIHDNSPRAKGPFVVVDAGALPPTLIASQLFGHERGAFTGAERRQQGAFELADGGTIFLDEIGELPLSVQPALLGVLERRSFRRLGGQEDIQVNVRLISATHRDLRSEANHGTFRADLYFRLAGARIVIPSLRERPEDVEPLVEHFVRELTGAPGSPFSEATMAALRAHRWSGNVRELRNVVESALALGNVNLDGSPAGQEQTNGGSAGGDGMGALRPYRVARAEALVAFEREYLTGLIERMGGNASAAARAADMDRPYLLTLLRRHGLR